VLRFQLLGPLRAWYDDIEVDLGPPARRAVLGLLVLAGGEPISRSELVDALWGERPPASVANVLQTHVKHLRRLLEPGRPAQQPSVLLPHVGGGYAIRADLVDSDLIGFRRLIGLAGVAEREGDTRQAAALLGEAVRLWRGQPLADIPSLAGHPKLVGLSAERRHTVTRFGEAMIAIGAAEDALPALGEAAAEQPLDEWAHATLIDANRAAGRRSAAFTVYHGIRARLADELGVSPGPKLSAAYLALLHDDVTTGAPADDPSRTEVPAQLPADVVDFSGRVDELLELDGLLPSTDGEASVPLVVISGSAGVGKTALAVHWAHRIRHRYPDGQLYANLRGHARQGPAQPIEILAAFLFSLGIPPDRAPLDVETAAALLRTSLAGRRVLIILDNAGGADQIRPLLPGNNDCLVLVTARERMVGLVARNGARHLVLDVLSRADALDLLDRVLDAHRLAADPEAAVEFARLCAHLPLALRIAAAKLADHPHCTVADHVAEMRAGNPLSSFDVHGDEQTAVRSAFDLSYRALPQPDQRLFRLLGLVPGADVTADAAAALAGTEEHQADRELQGLARAHLVEQHAHDRYRFHDLLRHYAVERTLAQDTEADRRTALHRLHEWYLRGVESAGRTLYSHMLRLPARTSNSAVTEVTVDAAARSEAARWLDAERSNIVATVQHAAGHGPRQVAWLLADAMRGYFWLSMRATEWSATATAGLAAASAEGAIQAQAAAQFSLADLNFRLSRYREAVRGYTRALLLARRADWPECQAAVLGNLGCVYWQAGRLTRAVTHLSRAFRRSRDIGQPAGQATALGNLGLVYFQLGRLEQAEKHYLAALDLHRQIGSRYGEAVNLSNLGQVRHVRGRPRDAVDLLTTAITLHGEAGDRYGDTNTHRVLAMTLTETGSHHDAIEHGRIALESARVMEDPRAEAEALIVLAGIRHRLGEHGDTAATYRRALELARSTGDRYPEIEALLGLATVEADIGLALRVADLAGQAGYRALEGQALTAAADIQLHHDNSADALRHAVRALSVHRETGHRLGEVRTLRALRRVLPDHQDSGTVVTPVST
jgi:DNA-binding SARP family transcriptional activator/tetratricopeptide (TPR) repeat protein